MVDKESANANRVCLDPIISQNVTFKNAFVLQYRSVSSCYLAEP